MRIVGEIKRIRKQGIQRESGRKSTCGNGSEFADDVLGRGRPNTLS